MKLDEAKEILENAGYITEEWLPDGFPKEAKKYLPDNYKYLDRVDQVGFADRAWEKHLYQQDAGGGDSYTGGHRPRYYPGYYVQGREKHETKEERLTRLKKWRGTHQDEIAAEKSRKGRVSDLKTKVSDLLISAGIDEEKINLKNTNRDNDKVTAYIKCNSGKNLKIIFNNEMKVIDLSYSNIQADDLLNLLNDGKLVKKVIDAIKK